MLDNLINITSLLISIFVVVFLIYLSRKTQLLRNALTKISFGVFVAITIHSLVELLEKLSYLSLNILLIIMPVFVIIGSIFIVIGCISMLGNTITPLKKVTKTLHDDASGIKDLMERFGEDNEIGIMLAALIDSRKKLEDLNHNLDQEVKKKSEDIQKKNAELEKTLDDFYTMRVGIVEQIDKGELEKENKLIKEKLDQIKKGSSE